MISNYRIVPQQQTKQRRFNNCPLKRANNNKNSNTSSIRDLETLINSHILYLESKDFEMSTLAADLRTATVTAAATVNAGSSEQPPMEGVVVNSIIYSKPSFCTLAVDLGDASSTRNENKMDANSFAVTNLSVPPPPADAKIYRICTTMNGSIHHQISELCENILAMAGVDLTYRSDDHVGDNVNDFAEKDDENNLSYFANDSDDDSLIEFTYKDDDNLGVGDNLDYDDEDDDDDDDDYDEEVCPDEDDEDDDDYDVVDFSYECPIVPAPKMYCAKKKKVRFNTKPTVHYMHTWSYAYRTARKGEWEMYARDRERFKWRIKGAASILNPILEREHREKMYEKRFVSLYDNENANQRKSATTVNQQINVAANVEDLTENKSMDNKETTGNESKKQHQKRKRRKRLCKMGNKHYF